MPIGYKSYILKDGPFELFKYPWHLLKDNFAKLEYELISWQNLSFDLILEETKKKRLLFLVIDPKTEKQREFVDSLNRDVQEKSLVIFLVGEKVSPSPALKKIQNVDIGLTPEFFVSYIATSMLASYFHLKYVDSTADELEWLRRIEKIFDLTREEILDSELKATAYENLLVYEEKLLEEQKRVSKALEHLQEFRDRTKKDWLEEQKAREALENLMARELRDRNEQVKAQELLLQYTAKEREALYSLIRLLKEKGSLSRQEVEELLQKQDVLLKDVERLLRLRESEG